MYSNSFVRMLLPAMVATLLIACGESFTPHPKPSVDCFYVYPTVSTDEAPNSDMKAGPGETNVIRAQFARFGEVRAGWGLHLIDMHLAMGNLIGIVKAQGEVYTQKRDM